MKMKKSLLISLILIVISGCQKTTQFENEKSIVLSNLKEIASHDYNGLLSQFGSVCLTVNPYYFIEDRVELAFNEFNKYLKFGEAKSEDLTSSLINLIKAEVPAELTVLPDEEYTELEASIFSIISQSIASDDIYTFNLRISCIEDQIIEANCLNLNAKTRILIYCAGLKSITNCLNRMFSETKGETWDDCFRRKQYEEMKKGILEKLRCVIVWPECLGLMAADCVIEVVF